jgi:hypothetical protein
MDFSTLPLPPANSDFIGGSTPRSHRSHHAAGYTLGEMLYNVRLTEARELASPQATPLRNAAETIFNLLK